MNKIIISPSAAKAQGLKRYFTGKPCKAGHVAPRYVASSICVECQRQQCPKRTKAYNRKWRAAHRDQRRQSLARWRAKNPDRTKEHDRRQRSKDIVKRRHHTKQWFKDHPEKAAFYNANRRAIRRNALGSFSEDDILKIYKLQKGRCAYCRTDLGVIYERDHIVPLTKGGTNYPRNIQLVCRLKCNQRKRNKDPIDYARSLGLLI